MKTHTKNASQFNVVSMRCLLKTDCYEATCTFWLFGKLVTRFRNSDNINQCERKWVTFNRDQTQVAKRLEKPPPLSTIRKMCATMFCIEEVVCMCVPSPVLPSEECKIPQTWFDGVDTVFGV